MAEIDREIRDRVDSFVAELSELVRQAALEAVSDALKTGAAPTPRATRGGRAEAPRRRSRGGRRSPGELRETQDKLFNEIRTNPGQRIEQIARAIDTPTKELALPITKLLSEKRIRREGQKRATKYFPASTRARGGGKKRAKPS